MMYTQGLKRLASNQAALQLLFGSSSRSMGLLYRSAQTFSVINTEQV